MATDIKEAVKQALDELPDEEAVEVLDFIGYLRTAAGEGRSVLV